MTVFLGRFTFLTGEAAFRSGFLILNEPNTLFNLTVRGNFSSFLFFDWKMLLLSGQEMQLLLLEETGARSVYSLLTEPIPDCTPAVHKIFHRQNVSLWGHLHQLFV